MNYCEIQKLLKEKDQTQLLKFYDTLSESEKEELLKQIASIDFSLIDLIDQRGIPVNKGKLEPLGALTVNEINKNTETYKKAGREAIRAGKIGAVLLAGGQGTRLGSDRPKGTVDIGISKTFYRS